MIPVRETTLKEMADTIVAATNPVCIYLFGSYARGNPRPDSDLDLLVVVNDRFGSGYSRLAAINRLRADLSRFRIAKDVLLYNTDEFEKWRHSRNHIIGQCLREGRLLYARP